MTVHIPEWVLWVAGGLGLVAVLGLAFLGIVFLRAIGGGIYK